MLIWLFASFLVGIVVVLFLWKRGNTNLRALHPPTPVQTPVPLDLPTPATDNEINQIEQEPPPQQQPPQAVKPSPKPALSEEEKKRKKEKQKQQKQNRKEKREQRELEELERLTAAVDKQRQEQEAKKKREQRIAEAKLHAEAVRRENEIERRKQEERQKKKEFQEEKRKAEELAKAKRFEEQVKSAWGVAPPTVDVKPLTAIQSETLQHKGNSNTNSSKEAYRRERKIHRRQLEDRASRDELRQQVLEERVAARKFFGDKVPVELDKKLESLVSTNKKKLEWAAEPNQFTIEPSGIAHVRGLSEQQQATVVGEGGSNIRLVQRLNVKINVSFDDQPISIRGQREDVSEACEKLKTLLQWKYYVKLAKKEAELSSQFRKDSLQGNDEEKVNHFKTESILHNALKEWALGEASKYCIRFHNEGFEPSRLDLTGLTDEDAFSLFKSKIETIEKTENAFDSYEVMLGAKKNPLSTLQRDIVNYLQEYKFEYDLIGDTRVTVKL